MKSTRVTFWYYKGCNFTKNVVKMTFLDTETDTDTDNFIAVYEDYKWNWFVESLRMQKDNKNIIIISQQHWKHYNKNIIT